MARSRILDLHGEAKLASGRQAPCLEASDCAAQARPGPIDTISVRDLVGYNARSGEEGIDYLIKHGVSAGNAAKLEGQLARFHGEGRAALGQMLRGCHNANTERIDVKCIINAADGVPGGRRRKRRI